MSAGKSNRGQSRLSRAWESVGWVWGNLMGISGSVDILLLTFSTRLDVHDSDGGSVCYLRLLIPS